MQPISFLKLILAPRLYRIYQRASSHNGDIYAPNIAERWGDFGVSYIFPVGAIYCMWQRRWNYFIYLGILIVSSYLLRAAGRAVNPTYLNFLHIINRAKQTFTTENAEILRSYDFEFSSWPVSFKATRFSDFSKQANRTGFSFMTPSWLIGWLVAHSFGIRLIYPGLLFGPIIRTPLEEGRAKLVMEKGGKRSRLQTADGNTLDTMFIDRRSDGTGNGNTLVICCEGNAGFYEIGMIGTPIELGYSVLGWNHPGFGGSTGTPYPENELNAGEAVFEYATKVLEYREEDIVLYGWSIGGFPATHLAKSHPNVKGLILDATFDDVLPLALPRMPLILSPIVQGTIRNHVNLHITKLLDGYQGPVRLIRRTEDEIISDPPGVLQVNRGNYLLYDLVLNRYPALFEDSPETEKALREWLGRSHVKDTPGTVAALFSEVIVPNDLSSLSSAEKARWATKIADKLLSDYKSSHCTPLPPSLFQLPWVDTQTGRLTEKAQ